MKLVTSNNESMGFNTNPIFSSNKNSLSTNNKEKEINNSFQNVIIIINIITLALKNEYNSKFNILIIL